MKKYILLVLFIFISLPSFALGAEHEVEQDASEFYKVVRVLERKVKNLDQKKNEILQLKSFVLRCEDAIRNNGGRISGPEMKIIEQLSVGGFVASSFAVFIKVFHFAEGHKFNRKQTIVLGASTLVILIASFSGQDYIHATAHEIIEMKKTIALKEIELKQSRAVLVKVLDDYKNIVTEEKGNL